MDQIPEEIFGVPIEIIIFIPIDIILIVLSLLWWLYISPKLLRTIKNYKFFLWVLIINIVFVIVIFLNKELENYVDKRLRQFIKLLKWIYCKYLTKISLSLILGTFFTFWLVQILALVHQRVGKVLKKYIFRLIICIFLLYFFFLNLIIFGNKLIKKDECLDIIK